MQTSVPQQRYPPDLFTPIATLRDVIELQIERARRLEMSVEHTLQLKRVA
jgi:hypothetical protein